MDSISEARPVRVAVGQELLDVDFSLLLVRTARVSGLVTNSDGTPTSSGQMDLMPDGSSTRGRGQTGANFRSRIEWDGGFAIANVPPGRYMLRARGDDTETPQYATQPLTVASVDVSDVTVVLYPGASINGTVTFEGSPAPQLNQIRISAPSAENALTAGNPNARVEKDGHFTLDGVPAGSHWIRSGGGLRGWSLKSVIVDSHDVADTPVELRSGEILNDVNVVFTNKQTEIDGTVTDERGNPITDFTVLAFPSDPLAVAAAGSSDHDGAAGPEREVPDSRSAIGHLLPRHRRSGGTGGMVRAGVPRSTTDCGRARDPGRRRHQDPGFPHLDTITGTRCCGAVYRSFHRNCKTLIAATGTASARSVR